jgi:hypothetical protein
MEDLDDGSIVFRVRISPSLSKREEVEEERGGRNKEEKKKK